jgi:hypothetical protein
VEERGPGYSLQRAFQRYEALGRDGSVSADEFRALLRNFNLEVSHDHLECIVAACRPLPPTTSSASASAARTPGYTPGRDASGLPRLDCRRFMERLKGLDHSALASSTPLSGTLMCLICSDDALLALTSRGVAQLSNNFQATAPAFGPPSRHWKSSNRQGGPSQIAHWARSGSCGCGV